MASKTYYLIYNAAVDFLRKSNSLGPDSSKSNKEIVSALKRMVSEGALSVEVTDGTFLNYLSWAANGDPDSVVVSGGPRAGYWLGEPVIQIPSSKPSTEDEISVGKGKGTKILEKDLYPLMELWLEKKGYKAKDTSTLKSGGKWGNPDIIGIERVDVFGAVQIELVYYEIKLSTENWELVIFEAISHKRFCNRSWFCVRTETEAASIPKGIDYYSER